jgi:hypothetical protein
MPKDAVLQTTSLEDLRSSIPGVRVKALEILYGNARMLYGERHPTTEAERLRLEDARLSLR